MPSYAAENIAMSPESRPGASTKTGTLSPALSNVNALSVPTMQVKKMTEHATLPVMGTPFAAGYDLAAAYDMEIPAGGKGIAKTDLAIKMPLGVYGRVAPRYSLNSF